MKENQVSLVQRIKGEIDELRLQAKLGKAEATDFIEEKKEEFGDFIDQTKERLEDSVAAREKIDLIHQKLDHLKVQLALGRMEAEDAYDEQKEKIDDAISEIRHELHDIEGAAGGILDKARLSFDHHAGAFSTKLQLMAHHFWNGSDTKTKLDKPHQEIHNELDSWSQELPSDIGKKDPHAVHNTWGKLKKTLRKLIE